jgi:hypothetical protein
VAQSRPNRQPEDLDLIVDRKPIVVFSLGMQNVCMEDIKHRNSNLLCCDANPSNDEISKSI